MICCLKAANFGLRAVLIDPTTKYKLHLLASLEHLRAYLINYLDPRFYRQKAPASLPPY